MIQEILNMMRDPTVCRKIVVEAKKRYSIKCYQIQKTNTKQVQQIIKSLQKNRDGLVIKKMSLNSQNYRQVQEKWAQRQLRIFVWLLVGYATIINKPIEQMTQKQFQIFEPIFIDKSSQFLCYKSLLLLQHHKLKWQQPEIQILNTIINQKQQALKQWNRISLELYFASQKKYFKPPQKCRQLWFNHLNPSVNKNKWTLDQDIQLINLAFENGIKWSLISKLMNNSRTQHMLKNRFLSLKKIHSINKKNLDEKKILKELKKKLSHALKQDSFTQSIYLQGVSFIQKNSIEQMENGSMQIQKQSNSLGQDPTVNGEKNKESDACAENTEPFKIYGGSNKGPFQEIFDDQFSIDISQYLNFY